MYLIKYFAFMLIVMSHSIPSFALDSIYVPGQKWYDESDKQIELPSLKGKYQIVSMIFTRCASACPFIVQDIRDLLKEVPKKSVNKIQVKLFSFDAPRETKDSLHSFRIKFKIDENWSLYRSNEGSVSMLAALLSVQYRRIDSGDYVHSNQIYLLDPDGAVVATIQGFDEDRSQFLKILKSL